MKICIFFILLASASVLFAQNGNQVSPGKYWVEFTDKANTPYQLNNPNAFLSERAIERRNRQGIAIDSSDLPVDPAYIQALKDLNLQVWSTSKWLNGAVIKTNDTALIDTIENLPFIASLAKPTPILFLKNQTPQSNSNKFGVTAKNSLIAADDYYSYGTLASRQIKMHHGEYLHNHGYNGTNMLIAILDAGFVGLYADFNRAFDSIKENQQIVFTYDFVSRSNIIDVVSHHGMNVLSIIGGNIPDTLIGTAPKADFALIRTEDSQTEYIVEEFYWASGAECADSIGADVINVSLGYTDYDYPEWSHTVNDYDGNTTWITQAANIAASKGMLVVVSSGNNGNNPVPNIGAPSDSPKVLSVGALQPDSVFAHFSSRGPTTDGRIKPDVMSVGHGTILQLNGYVGFGSGTSFSAPVMCGLTACLWQAHPNAKSAEVMDAIKASSNLYTNPNDSMGYGIPNFIIANDILNVLEQEELTENNQMIIYPNPISSNFVIRFSQAIEGPISIYIINNSGQLVYRKEISTLNYAERIFWINDFIPEAEGMYFLKIEANGNTYQKKLIKIR